MRIGYLMQHGVEVRRPPYDGPANHVRHVVRELERLGHRVRLVVNLDGTLWRSDNLTEFEPLRVPWLDRGPARLFERAIRRVQYELQLPYAALFESLRFALACTQALRGYDLLYERMSWAGYGGGLAARWLRIPLVLENNGDHLADLEAKGIAPRGMQRRLSLALTAGAVKRASHIVVSGDGWRGQFIQRWGVDPKTVTTVENGTVLVELLKREQLGCFQVDDGSRSTTSLVYVGGFYPWHGVTILLRAFARALAQGLPLRLLLVGSGAGLDEARGLVEELAISGSVHFTGQLSPNECAPLLANADIGLSPYCGWPEFSGLKIFDYKAAGLATIASGRDGHPPTLRHGHTGWIVAPCDEEALFEAIVRLSSDRQLRRRLGQAARLEAESFHGWDQTARRLERLLTQVVAEHESRRRASSGKRGISTAK